MLWNNSLYGNFRTRTFAEIWPSSQDFLNDFLPNPLNAIYENMIESQYAEMLYYHLFARYGNSHIANSDENQFKFKVYSIFARFGPTWLARYKIQMELRDTSSEALSIGSKQIYNKAYNPAEYVGTGINDEIQTLNEQTVAKSQRGVLETRAVQLDLIETDITGPFIERFKDLFVIVVQPRVPLWYETDTDDRIIVGDDDDDT